jgi:hypothetical protein
LGGFILHRSGLKAIHATMPNRAFHILTETWKRSKYLFLRIFLTRTAHTSLENALNAIMAVEVAVRVLRGGYGLLPAALRSQSQ